MKYSNMKYPNMKYPNMKYSNILLDHLCDIYKKKKYYNL